MTQTAIYIHTRWRSDSPGEHYFLART